MQPTVNQVLEAFKECTEGDDYYTIVDDDTIQVSYTTVKYGEGYTFAINTNGDCPELIGYSNNPHVIKIKLEHIMYHLAQLL